jgi:hypothetical protein
MAVQLDGLRTQVDPIGLGASAISTSGSAGSGVLINKERPLLKPIALFTVDPEPCFASKKAEAQYYDRIWFPRIRSLLCQLPPWDAV